VNSVRIRLSSRNGGALAIAERHSRIVRALRIAGPGCGDPVDGAIIPGVDLQSVPDAVAQLPLEMGNLGRFRHQDHDGVAASAATRRIGGRTKSGQNRDPGCHRSAIASNSRRCGQGVDGGSSTARWTRLTADGYKQQLARSAQVFYLQTTAGYEAWMSPGVRRHGQGTVTRTNMSCEMGGRNAVRRQLRSPAAAKWLRFDGTS